ncbi:MAG: hypothetical protein U0805_20910 [Pirellulales bacterium]
MGRHGLTEPAQRFPTGASSIAANRIVKLASDNTLALAGASDENAIGVTRGACAANAPLDSGSLVTLFSNGGGEYVEVAAGETVTRGNVVYQAASGKVAATGTVRAGIAGSSGTAGELIELLFIR